MYFVDREWIERRLTFLETQVHLFETIDGTMSIVEKVALERVAHLIIEVVLDVGNAMIDGFIMRDPGSYEDIIDILDDEKVVSPDMSKQLKQMLGFRRALVQDYTEINHEDVKSGFQEILPTIKEFPVRVRSYLTNELGPVSAFKK